MCACEPIFVSVCANNIERAHTGNGESNGKSGSNARARARSDAPRQEEWRVADDGRVDVGARCRSTRTRQTRLCSEQASPAASSLVRSGNAHVSGRKIGGAQRACSAMREAKPMEQSYFMSVANCCFCSCCCDGLIACAAIYDPKLAHFFVAT